MSSQKRKITNEHRVYNGVSNVIFDTKAQEVIAKQQNSNKAITQYWLRLDQILGKQGSKAKDVYASKVSLASRVVKVERQVDDIETKLDQFMELYVEDRKRFLALPIITEPSSEIGTVSKLSPAALKPKPILMEKLSSEPTSPTSITTFKEPSSVAATRRPMYRGFSDLGNRIKKKVTLSSPYDGDVVIVVPSIEQPSSSYGNVAASSIDSCITIENLEDEIHPKITESSELFEVIEDHNRIDRVYTATDILVSRDYEDTPLTQEETVTDLHLLRPRATTERGDDMY